jgi:hypothetical protein
MHKLLTAYFLAKDVYLANKRNADGYYKMVSAARKVIAYDRKHPMALVLLAGQEFDCGDSIRAFNETRIVVCVDDTMDDLLDIAEGGSNSGLAFSTTRFLGE